MWDMCHFINMEPFTQTLSQGRFSPFARSECGRTWLHIAAAYNNPELCSLLVSIGVDVTHTDDYGAKALHELCNPWSSQVDTMRVLMSQENDISAEDLSLVLDDWFSGSPECVDLLLSAYSYSEETYHASVQDSSLLRIAVREYGSGNMDWASSIRKYLRCKPDIHMRSFTSEGLSRHGVMADRAFRFEYLSEHNEMTFTLLDELFALNNDPFQAELVAQEWLLMLAEADYDINTYLNNEKRVHLDQDLLSYPECSSQCSNIYRQLVFEIGEHSKVSWDWWIDPSSHSSLALREFRYINPCHNDRFVKSEYWEDYWPFSYPLWSKNCMPRRPESLEKSKWQKRADQAARRYNRQAKKKYLGYFGDIAERVVIPGAWVEDDV